MKPLIAIFLLSTLLLSACGSTISGVTTIDKTPFIIDTYTVGQTQTGITIEKTGRITASSSLTLSAQGAGEISKITVKEGQNVKAGAVIATLKDTQNNYDLRYSQAVNTLKVQNASIETTRINLLQSVDAARISYERARQAYETLTGKNALSYDTLVNTNSKTLDAYNESYKTYLSDAERIMTSMLYEADKILGITTNFEYANDAWEPYLGTRVGDSRALANNEWNTTYVVRGDLRAKIEKSKNINLADPIVDFDTISKSYDQSRKLADAMLYMLQNSVVGGGLPQELLSGWVAAWNGQRGTIQASEGGYNGWRAGTLTFFKGYKNTEIANRLALASLSRAFTPEETILVSSNNDIRITYENARIDLKDKVENARLNFEQAQKSYDTAQALKSATLIQLDANRENAKIALQQAERDASKLRVTAPVDGIISRVIASVGQTVNIGSQIAEFTGRQPQIIIDVAPSLVASLAIGDSVGILVSEHTLTGIITALSTVANANLLSTIRIAISDAGPYIGESATVSFVPQNETGNNGNLTLPLDSVSIIAEGEGELYIYTQTGIVRQSIKIGQTLGDTIEVISPLANGTQVIITDMSNYDASKQILEKKKIATPSPQIKTGTGE
ncbi:HlyD family efflux transporter periplasmic adaptor subunit [Candidatus Gracilibacteria bacterium]|nr:HlyD family efflux transporter periplasmic adaptor subunit [Candidatus Gracilibacteria bacterium]